MKVYSVRSQINNYAFTSVISLNKQVLDKYIEECIKPLKGLSFLSEIKEEEHPDIIYLDNHQDAFTRFLTEGVAYVGKCHQDAKCTGIYSYYTTSSLLDEATMKFKEIAAKQKERSNDYYSQLWI